MKEYQAKGGTTTYRAVFNALGVQMSTVTEERPRFVYEIKEENFARLVEKFGKMVRRSKKLRQDPPRFEVIHEADEEIVVKKADRMFVPDDDYETYGAVPRSNNLHLGDLPATEERRWVHYLYVTVEGQRPKVAGWEFVATIDHTEGVPIIKGVPGAGNVPAKYRTTGPRCDHCNKTRLRHETFIVRKTDDPTRFQQVGRNCLADFFDGASPEDIATAVMFWTEAGELLGADDDEEGGGGYYSMRYGLEHVLHVTQAVIENFGWMSATKARELDGATPTSCRVRDYLNPPFKPDRDYFEFRRKVAEKINIEKNQPVVEAALAWARGLDPETAEDYLYNLHAVCVGEAIRLERLGLACSLLPAYRRFIDGEKKKEEGAKAPESDYVGEVGKRTIILDCRCVHVGEPFDNGFNFGGITRRILFAVGGKDILLWYATGFTGDNFEKDRVYDIVATPKKQEERENKYKGRMEKQTTVNRVALAKPTDYKKYKASPTPGVVTRNEGG